MCYTCFSSPSVIDGIVKFGEKSTVLITFSYLVYFIYTLVQLKLSTVGKIYHHVSPWVNQYRQYVVFTFSTIQVPWYSFVLVSQSNYHAMYNWSNNCWWGHDGQSIFRVIFACVITGHHSFRVQLVSDVPRPKKKIS